MWMLMIFHGLVGMAVGGLIFAMGMCVTVNMLVGMRISLFTILTMRLQLMD